MKTVKVNEFKQQRLLNSVALSSLMLTMSACGTANSPISNVVTNVTLKTSTVAGDNWVAVDATLVTGNFQLASLNIPVTDPKTMKEYGQLTILPNLCSGSCVNNGGELILSVNLTEATLINGVDPLLPNGTPLPIGGLSNSTVIGVPVQNTGAMIYFAFGKGVAMVGAAVPFKALDVVGQYVAGADIFIPMQFKGVGVSAGLFIGTLTNTTGVGLFVDLSSVLNPVTPAPSPTVKAALSAMAVNGSVARNSAASEVSNVLQFKTVKPSASKERDIYYRLYQLNSQGGTLGVE
jgi:hypothetical protein